MTFRHGFGSEQAVFAHLSYASFFQGYNKQEAVPGRPGKFIIARILPAMDAKSMTNAGVFNEIFQDSDEITSFRPKKDRFPFDADEQLSENYAFQNFSPPHSYLFGSKSQELF
jgi:hypothetical protein